ncbi:hypothetical protein [Burkholderia glumae]
MKISQIYRLGKSQAELDFIDIDPSRDTPLFLDPHHLGQKNDPFSIDAHRSVEDFFSFLLSLIRDGAMDEARALFENLHEPNETCLGVSTGTPDGRGVGPGQADDIFHSIAQSRAVQSGVVEHLEDCRIFVPFVGRDKVSDMTTNVIRDPLIRYTQNQCRLHSIPLRPNTPTGFFWNRANHAWENRHDEMLVVDGKVILLVPKASVSFSKDFGLQKYHQHFVLNFLQAEQLRTNGPFVHRRQRRDGSERVWVVKKELADSIAPATKDYSTNFTLRHSQVFTDFKRWADRRVRSLSNEEIAPAEDVALIARYLSERLAETPVGNDSASAYHRLMVGVTELIFYPHLTCPQVEREINEGRKRIDIVFDNAATEGFFWNVHQIRNIPAQYIMVECKNYGREVGNPEVDQLSGRFGANRGQVGLLLCRSVENFERLLTRCRDIYRDKRELIVPLLDADFHEILRARSEDINDRQEERIMQDRARDIIMA